MGTAIAATGAQTVERRSHALRWVCLLIVFTVVSGCATRPYQPANLAGASFLQRAIEQDVNGVKVSAAVPTAAETIAITGLDLYAQGIQPVWIRVDNRTESQARVVTWSIDPDYFAPIEVAYMNRKRFSKQGYADMERWFHENGLQRRIAAGGVASGLVFTNLQPGTKGFNLTLVHDGQTRETTFFLPLPGFVPDFMAVDFAGLYPQESIRELDDQALVDALENDLHCCATDRSGDLDGGPFNLVLIGSGSTLRKALLRGGWLETSADPAVVPRARQQSFDGRRPDAVFSRRRGDGSEVVAMHLWYSPWRHEGLPVWVGQVYYAHTSNEWLKWIDSQKVRDTDIYRFFARESPLADVDSAMRYLYQNLWYSGAMSRVGYVRGMDNVPVESPRTTFGGSAYFTEGLRLVALLSDRPRALDEVIYLNDPRKRAPGGTPDKPFRGSQVPPPNDRIHIQKKGPLTVATAVPSAEETRGIFDVDLYAKNIQPVWVQIENNSDEVLQLAPMGIDKNYYSPREAADRTRGRLEQRQATHYEQRVQGRLAVPPHSIQSSYILSRVDEGTKSFNLDVVGQDQAHLMSFFVPVPGLKLDHYDLDPDALYSPEDTRDLSLPELVAELEAMPCCVRDAAGNAKGDPLNLVFVGRPEDLYYAFMRAGWDETETIYGASLWKTGVSAIFGDAYRYSPVSPLYVFGRAQDAAFQRARSSIHERNHLRVWMTPLRFQGLPVWIGQISRDIGVRFTRKTITTHKIDPDVDETREFLVEDMAFTQGLRAFGYVGGVGAADYDRPRANLTGDPYFTDGLRALMWLSGEPVSLDAVQYTDLTPYRTGVVGR